MHLVNSVQKSEPHMVARSSHENGPKSFKGEIYNSDEESMNEEDEVNMKKTMATKLACLYLSKWFTDSLQFWILLVVVRVVKWDNRLEF